MINNINYGTALLASTVKFGSNTLKDNNSALHPGESDQKWTVTNNGLAVTGILVGGQAEQMGWNFVRYPSTDNDFDKTIYDKLTSAYWVGNTTEPIYTLVWDNYDATKAADLVVIIVIRRLILLTGTPSTPGVCSCRIT